MNTEFSTKSGESSLSEQEKIIKEQLESWIVDIYKNVDLEQRLQKEFHNNSRDSN